MVEAIGRFIAEVTVCFISKLAAATLVFLSLISVAGAQTGHIGDIPTATAVPMVGPVECFEVAQNVLGSVGSTTGTNTRLCNNSTAGWASAFGFASPNDPAVNITSLGAINDSASHEACTVLGLANLGQLQAYKSGIFSFATSCHDQIAWLAAQAIANANENIYVPAGPGFVMDSAAASSGTLVLNNSSIIGVSSGITASGYTSFTANASILYWPTDLGSGTQAIICGSTGSRYCSGQIEHIAFSGPGPGSTSPGTHVASMDGLFWGAREEMHDVAFNAFNKCLDIVGDQSLIEEVHTWNCSYGLYFDTPSANFGDIVFIKNTFLNSSIAAVGVNAAGSAQINGDTFIQNCFCAAPWAILGEFGGSSTPTTVITISLFLNNQYEDLGNGIIGDDDPSNDYLMEEYNDRWLGVEFTWNAGHKNPSLPANGVYSEYLIAQTTIDGVWLPQFWTAGSKAVFNVENLEFGSVTGLITSMGTPISVVGGVILNFNFNETGTLNAAALAVNGGTATNCSGTPSSSFAVISGIVTHC